MAIYPKVGYIAVILVNSKNVMEIILPDRKLTNGQKRCVDMKKKTFFNVFCLFNYDVIMNKNSVFGV